MTRPSDPPFTLTPAIVSLVVEIGEWVGRAPVQDESPTALRLRRINRIRTIQGSLAIEGNTLSVDQITAILSGQRVLAPPREIQEAKNALLAYERMEAWNPVSEKDLLAAQGVLMTGLVDQPGTYRSSGVGVMAGKRLVHMAPPASRVPPLMKDLLRWLKATQHHPLIASCVFHYEFEFIHPFPDGNGRMGRLWQTLILSQWKPFFAFLPVESMVYEHQRGYYQALNESSKNGSSTAFLEFMLPMIRDTLRSLPTEQVNEQETEQVRRLLAVMGEGAHSAKELLVLLGLSHRPTFLYNYLQPALAAGLLKMTAQGSPRSPRQKYRLSAKGRALRTALLSTGMVPPVSGQGGG